MKHYLLTFFLFFLCLTASAEDITYTYQGKTLTYTILDEKAKTCKLKNGNNKSQPTIPGNVVTGEVVIPSKITNGEDTYTVTEIGDYAFYDCKGLTSIIISNTITTIGNSAFYSCSGLKSLTIPNSVITIGREAFMHCYGLTSVIIPNSVITIGRDAFFLCIGLTSVTIPNSVTTIGSDAFYGCNALTAVNIQDMAAWCSIKFEDNPLSYAHNLYLNGGKVTELVIPNTVTTISENAFDGCSSLTSVSFPNSVSTIGKNAFYGCI